MATYLINASHEQKIATEEHGVVKVLAYSNPAYYESKSLARDFGGVNVGDFVVICRNSKMKYLVKVEEVVMATDATDGGKYIGLPVKLLKGSLIKRLGDISVGAATCKMIHYGLAPPNLINKELTGFKQRAFAEILSLEQAEHYANWST